MKLKWLVPIVLVVVALLLGLSFVPTGETEAAPLARPTPGQHPLMGGAGFGGGNALSFYQAMNYLELSHFTEWKVCPKDTSNVLSYPMVWDFGDIWKSPVCGDGDTLFTFNEPERPDQANMTPWWGAVGIRNIKSASKFDGYKLATPALCPAMAGDTDYPGNDGWQWLIEMREEYKSLYGEYPDFDVLAFHMYTTSPDDVQAVMDQAAYWAWKWDIPEIVINETGVLVGPDQCNYSDRDAYADAVMDACESKTKCSKVFWFIPWSSAWENPDCPHWGSNLLHQNGNLTEMGEAVVYVR